ncbi:MAG: ATP-dependent Clp protease proteolytic subunit [Parvularculaceae bacterium]|nr:ATP-dependent Clp protease proteolytic subunit [Parvularculaceae bacterium]
MDDLFGSLPFLLLLVFFFIIPAITRRQRGAEVERRFSKIQRKRKSRVIAIVHRQEPMGLLGIPVLRYIDLNDAEDVLEAIRTTPKSTPIDLVLHTPGGLVLPALQIARAIKAHPARTTVFVPHYAMSGGTLIALAADEIILNRHAVLGPIDPQIGGVPAASLVRLRQEKSADATDDYTYVLADVGQMAIDQLKRAARELLSGTISDNAAMAVADQLATGKWTHDYPIEAGEAREIGLNVSTDFPDDISELMALFPDRLSRSNVKFISSDGLFSLFRAKPKGPRPEMRGTPPLTERTPFTGYEPHAGARSFSYGPWNPKDIRDQTPPGPSAEDVLERPRRR